MNKKEVNEIRKQFSPSNCAITRICGCYVDYEKQKKAQLKDAFLSLSEEENFKYYTIFKKALSGTVGKNLLNMEFPAEQEQAGGTHEFLMKLLETKLTDDDLLEEFYDKIIATYDYPENYYIILIHSAYDVPGKSTDGSTMDDASDFVYDHILCCICPVKLSKAGLSYNAEKNTIEERVRDWVVEVPDNAFLFPAFNDRNTDIHSLLYYAKNPEKLQTEMVNQVLGCQPPLTLKGQKSTFQAIVEETLGQDCNFEAVKTIHENLNELVADREEDPVPLELGKTELKKLLLDSAVSNDNLKDFEETYETTVSQETSLVAANVASTKTLDIKTSDVVIKVNPEKSHLIENRIIDGVPCLVIEISDAVEVNGIHVRAIPAMKETNE